MLSGLHHQPKRQLFIIPALASGVVVAAMPTELRKHLASLVWSQFFDHRDCLRNSRFKFFAVHIRPHFYDESLLLLPGQNLSRTSSIRAMNSPKIPSMVDPP
jgi:hypothetical protein